jgi:hypothetical protein
VRRPRPREGGKVEEKDKDEGGRQFWCIRFKFRLVQLSARFFLKIKKKAKGLHPVPGSDGGPTGVLVMQGNLIVGVGAGRPLPDFELQASCGEEWGGI